MWAQEIARSSGGHSTCQEVHQGRLSCTIGAHNCDATAHVYTDIQLLEAKVLAAGVLEVHVIQLDEGMCAQLCGFWELEVHCVVGPFARSSRLVGILGIVILFTLVLPLLSILRILLNLQGMKGNSCANTGSPCSASFCLALDHSSSKSAGLGV